MKEREGDSRVKRAQSRQSQELKAEGVMLLYAGFLCRLQEFVNRPGYTLLTDGSILVFVVL